MFREGSGGGAKTFRWCGAAGEIYFTSGMLQLKAKAKRPLYIREAAPSGTIENVGCDLPSETKRKSTYCAVDVAPLARLTTRTPFDASTVVS